MCGLLGVLSPHSTLPSERELDRWRDRISHRGPDDSGVWRGPSVALAHCRLSVRDVESGAQPMTSADGRWVLIYNGELYNDAELRLDLSPAGGWRTRSDTETVLAALEARGEQALGDLRGMYALAAYDTREGRLLLARDPLGIKPLYWWCDGERLVFGSEPHVILQAPGVPVRPNLRVLSAYLTTLRTTLGGETLFEGVRSLEPWERLTLDVGQPVLRPRVHRDRTGVPVRGDLDPAEAAARLGEALSDSVHRHLASDVPVALMLSGGLDSAVLGHLAAHHAPGLHTYTAGVEGAHGGEIESAGQLAGELGLPHHGVHLDGPGFAHRWRELVATLGVPLSTPNEIAIHDLAQRMRADGNVVALSGEGSDELLGGYGSYMDAAASYCEGAYPGLSGGRFHLEAGAWVPPSSKAQLLRPDVWAALEDDGALIDEYDLAFERCEAEVGDEAEPLDAHLRFLRHVNLPRLLRRLDTSTMAASIEGRTPFADVAVAALCEELPMSVKFERRSPGNEEEGPRTKRALRQAFAGRLPGRVLGRPKDSFSLPFQDWFGDQGGELLRSPFARRIFDPGLLESIGADPAQYWKFAWPMMNVSLWGDRWFD